MHYLCDGFWLAPTISMRGLRSAHGWRDAREFSEGRLTRQHARTRRVTWHASRYPRSSANRFCLRILRVCSRDYGICIWIRNLLRKCGVRRLEQEKMSHSGCSLWSIKQSSIFYIQSHRFCWNHKKGFGKRWLMGELNTVKHKSLWQTPWANNWVLC